MENLSNRHAREFAFDRLCCLIARRHQTRPTCLDPCAQTLFVLGFREQPQSLLELAEAAVNRLHRSPVDFEASAACSSAATRASTSSSSIAFAAWLSTHSAARARVEAGVVPSHSSLSSVETAALDGLLQSSRRLRISLPAGRRDSPCRMFPAGWKQASYWFGVPLDLLKPLYSWNEGTKLVQIFQAHQVGDLLFPEVPGT
jgi:hypothetical protein